MFKRQMYKERKTINITNGSHYYNKEMIAKFLIMISVNPGSFKTEEPGRQVGVIASPPPPCNAKQGGRQVADVRLLLPWVPREIKPGFQGHARLCS